ncbi:MAG: hypothetical protein JO265_03725 [Acidimicrobiia bacterium]|nr:hypothetical protein [Acidimicrobiia bacterium]
MRESFSAITRSRSRLACWYRSAAAGLAWPTLPPAREPTIVLLGHERAGVSQDWVDEADDCLSIPMVGVGASLNVAVSGSLVLYRLAGLA